MKPALRPGQRGVAFILVLWVIALMSILLGSFVRPAAYAALLTGLPYLASSFRICSSFFW